MFTMKIADDSPGTQGASMQPLHPLFSSSKKKAPRCVCNAARQGSGRSVLFTPQTMKWRNIQSVPRSPHGEEELDKERPADMLNRLRL